MSLSAAQAIARGLAGAGCRHAFGIPGGEVLALMDALDQAGIAFTLAKHENAAGYMAEGSWQATGAPGILLTTIGPGLANAVNAIANAYQEQVPLIVLSGCISPAQASQFTHQVIDQRDLLAPITKATFQVAEGDAAVIVAKALAIARADPPGPVHIDLPDTLALRPVADIDVPAPIGERPVLAQGVMLKQALRRLVESKNPIIVAGIGAVLHEAGPEILRLSENHSIPVITTYKAKGIIPETHPNALGGHGLSPLSDEIILPLLRQSDCVICLGYDPIEMRSDWIRPWAPQVAMEFVHAQAEHGMHGSALRHVGDVAKAAHALADGIEPLQNTWPGGEPEAARRALASAFAPRSEWGPHAVFATLDSALPDQAVITVDSGAHRILFSQMFHANRPGQLLQSAAFCSMGVAAPLAIGVHRAAPDLPVVAVVGDGGMDMVAGELATLRDIGGPLVIVVLVDDALTLIGRKQHAMQLGQLGVAFGATDFAALARAYGGHGETVESVSALKRALQEGLARDGFTLLACRIDKSGYNGAF